MRPRRRRTGRGAGPPVGGVLETVQASREAALGGGVAATVRREASTS